MRGRARRTDSTFSSADRFGVFAERLCGLRLEPFQRVILADVFSSATPRAAGVAGTRERRDDPYGRVGGTDQGAARIEAQSAPVVNGVDDDSGAVAA
jgi:hypothetical protein